MNRELELDLAEMGLSEVAAVLRAAPQARVRPGFALEVMRAVRSEPRRPRGCFRFATLLPIAACLALCMAVGSLFFRQSSGYSAERLIACQRTDGTFTATPAAAYVQAFAVTALARDPSMHEAALDSAVAALVRDQDASGGWANASITARNVAALRLAAEAGVASASRAYKQGLRYLRIHGLAELSPVELANEARDAVTRLGSQADVGLACSLALCAAS